jgi:hypothetical protein
MANSQERSLTPAPMIEAFAENNGVHPGSRRNHAKGVCVSYFSPRSWPTSVQRRCMA